MANVTKREMEIRKEIQKRAYKEGVKYGREHGTGAMIDNALEEINHIYEKVRRMESDISVMFHLQKQSMKNSPEVLAVQEKIRDIIHRYGEDGDAIVNLTDFEEQLGIYEVCSAEDRHREIITKIAIELMDDLRCKETQDEWIFYFLINYPNEDEGRKYLHRLPYCCGDRIVNMGESVASSSRAGGYKEGQANIFEPEKISAEDRHRWGLEWKYGWGEV